MTEESTQTLNPPASEENPPASEKGKETPPGEEINLEDADRETLLAKAKEAENYKSRQSGADQARVAAETRANEAEDRATKLQEQLDNLTAERVDADFAALSSEETDDEKKAKLDAAKERVKEYLKQGKDVTVREKAVTASEKKLSTAVLKLAIATVAGEYNVAQTKVTTLSKNLTSSGSEIDPTIDELRKIAKEVWGEPIASNDPNKPSSITPAVNTGPKGQPSNKSAKQSLKTRYPTMFK